MSSYEYKAVPAPTSGTKAKGVKTPENRFALSLTNLLNEMSGEGWEYVRAETLPSEERKGLTGRETVEHNILIFRRWTGPSPLQAMIEGGHAAPEALTAHFADDIPDAPPLGPASRR